MLEQLKARFPLLADKSDAHAGYYHRIEVPAKTVLLREGEVSKKAFLVEKGCLRAWFNNKGNDVTFQFAFENEVFSGAESFRKNIPSFFTIETVEPSVLHWIHKKDLEPLMKQADQEALLDRIFERQYHYMQHFLSLIRDTPEERYLKLLKEKPHIIQRVPLQYIATYLGITPVSLSRIRNRLAR